MFRKLVVIFLILCTIGTGILVWYGQGFASKVGCSIESHRHKAVCSYLEKEYKQFCPTVTITSIVCAKNYRVYCAFLKPNRNLNNIEGANVEVLMPTDVPWIKIYPIDFRVADKYGKFYKRNNE